LGKFDVNYLLIALIECVDLLGFSIVSSNLMGFQSFTHVLFLLILIDILTE